MIDTEKRLNILFDHLNNEDLLKPDTVQNILQLSGAILARDYATAQAIHLDVLTNKTEECGQWMVCCTYTTLDLVLIANCLTQVGIKRLIAMSKATP